MVAPIREVSQEICQFYSRAASKGDKACFSTLGHMSEQESELYDPCLE